jgi:hypothetical protein
MKLGSHNPPFMFGLDPADHADLPGPRHATNQTLMKTERC